MVYMEIGLASRYLDYARERKKWIILLGLVGVSSYGAYKVYHLPSVVRKRRRIVRLFGAIIALAEAVSDSAETVSVMSKELKEFLSSDTDEIPASLKQLSKIARSDEFCDSVVRVSQAVMIGMLRGYKVESDNRSEIHDMGFCDRVMDKLMTSAGTGFVSVVVGSFARNLVLGLCSNDTGSGQGLHESGWKSNSLVLPRWVHVLSDDKSRLFIADCIKNFVSTAVAVYLDKTMDVNLYDEMFSGLTNPKHQGKVTDLLVSLCNGAIETFVTTSYQVFKASNSSDTNLVSSSSDHTEASSMKNPADHGHRISSGEAKEISRSVDPQRSGWVNSVSSTLAVPSNRQFVLDVTGRVTFETVRSLVEFFLWKIYESLKRSLNIMYDEAAKRGFEVVSYVGAKSSVLVTICLAFFLHLGSSQAMLPA